MKDMEAVRFNEKVKRASTLVGAGGLALLFAGVSRWFTGGLDLLAASWIFLACGIIWVSVQINELIDAEEK